MTEHSGHAQHEAMGAMPGMAEHDAGSTMEHAGHGGMHMGNLKRRFFVCLALAVPVLLLSPMMGVPLPFSLTFPGADWLVLALCTALYFYGGMPFLQGAVGELRQKSPAMMALIALGITVAYLYSLYAFVMNHFVPGAAHVMDFFWELATLIVIMLLGHWLEMRAVAGAGDALQKMAELLPGVAYVQSDDDGSVREVPLKSLRVGQRVLVKPGAKMPADGVVEQGESAANEAMVTGEARDVPKAVGDKVIGGSINGTGTLLVRVTGTGESGYLAQVMQLVGSARQDKSRAEGMADKVAKWLFYVALAAGVLAFAAWLAFTGSVATALTRMVTVLIIACPHALGLAIPLVVARSTSLGAKNGLLVKDRRALEKAAGVDTVMMDKTGTLTEGRFGLRQVQAAAGYNENTLLELAGGLEQGSSHPLAAGVMEGLRQKGLQPARVENTQNLPGAGLQGTLADGRSVKLVSAAWLEGQNVPYPKQQAAALMEKGYTLSVLLVEGKAAGLLALGDEPRPDAAQVVQKLKQYGTAPVMLTGDNEKAAATAAQSLGIEEYRAQLLPQNKETVVREYQSRGKTVMMVGDGVNDAPALARADVGVAIGAGTDVAVDSADVVLVRSDPADILHFLSLAKNTTRKMKQNLWWGAGYNIVAIPLAAGVLAPLGILLSPAVGAVLMSLSTLIVAANAFTLRIE